MVDLYFDDDQVLKSYDDDTFLKDPINYAKICYISGYYKPNEVELIKYNKDYERIKKANLK